MDKTVTVIIESDLGDHRIVRFKFKGLGLARSNQIGDLFHRLRMEADEVVHYDPNLIKSRDPRGANAVPPDGAWLEPRPNAVPPDGAW